MTDLPQVFQEATVKRLNATPLSQNVAMLLKQNKVPVSSRTPVVIELMEWAAANKYADPTRAEEELGIVVRAALRDPEAVYENLTSPAMETAQTLEDAAGFLLANLADAIDDRTLPQIPR